MNEKNRNKRRNSRQGNWPKNSSQKGGKIGTVDEEILGSKIGVENSTQFSHKYCQKRNNEKFCTTKSGNSVQNSVTTV